MASKVKLKEAFEVDAKHGAFYTGGNVERHNNILYCQSAASISLLDITTGTVNIRVGDDSAEDADTIQTFTANLENVVTSHKSGLLKLWSQDGALQKMWKYIHKGPVARLVLDGDRLASGGSDGTVRIWDLSHQACILNLKGCFGVVTVVVLHPFEKLILGSGDDGKINAWHSETGELIRVYEGHFSKVTSIAVFHTCFVSSGRDKVLILWDVHKGVALRTVPVYEAVETVVGLPGTFSLPNMRVSKGKGIFVATGGENATIRVWDMMKSKEIYVQSNSLVSKSEYEGGLAVTKLIYDQESHSMVVVGADHNIMLHNLETFECLKQFVGFSDEILDLTFVGRNDSHIAVATNSTDVKLYENSTMNCQLLKGHTDLVLCVTTSKSNPNIFMSSAKDKTIRLWLFQDGFAKCAGIGLRHTGSVDSVCFSNLETKFVVSGGQDTCLKLWQLPENLTNVENASLSCVYTELAHQKGINCVTVSPNDEIVATASQDKTAKLWSANSLQVLGVLRGHRRGIWCVRFSPIDQVVMTASTDSTIKLWSITDLHCLKTIEGHEASVHRAEFVSRGLQILSVGADGLIKLFNLKSSECSCTLDQHEERVWALALRNDESGFITGGADSLLIKWKDVTEEKRLTKAKEEEEVILQEQQLNNLLHKDELLEALKLSLRLDRPLQTLRIVQGIIKKGETGLGKTIRGLRNDQKEALLKCAVDWNTNSRNCQAAQLVLNQLLNEVQTGEFRAGGLGGSIENCLPYTERHFKRLTQSLQDLHFISYTINCMQPHAKNFT